MPRPLTFWEKAGFIARHPIDVMSVPYSSLGQDLIKDDYLGCVLMFPMSDGTYTFTKADDVYPNCTWNEGDTPTQAFLNTLAQETASRGQDVLDKAYQVIVVLIILLIIYFVVSGKATKFIQDLRG